MDEAEIRAQFPHTAETVYLNHAATSPLSRPVRRAIDGFLEERHRTHVNNFDSFRATVAETRTRIARLLGTDAARIAFVPNTSTGLNVLALGFPWEEGDRIALPDCEFPANVYPFLNLQREGVAVDFIPDEEGKMRPEAVQNILRPETRLLSISWVQYLSGFRADLERIAAICKANDVWLCVDGIQGVGALEIDVETMGIDFLSTGTHKWLMGTQGLGFIYISEALQAKVRPPMVGWLHGPIDWENLSDYRLEFSGDATRYHSGTLNHAGVAALHAALGFHSAIGASKIQQRVLKRSTELARGLDELNVPRYGVKGIPESGIVAVTVSDPEGLVSHLAEENIEAAHRGGCVRLAPTFYNSAEEIDRVLAEIEWFLSRSD